VAEEDRYRLAPVREARGLAEREKRGELAAAVGDARAAEQRLTSARTRVAAARDALASAVATRDAQRTAGTRVRAERFVARRRREVELALADELHAEVARDSQQGTVDIARRTLARARAERELIERHFARWREARRKLVDRRED